MRSFRQLTPALLVVSCSPCSAASSTRCSSTASGRLAFNDKADGSLIERDGAGRRQRADRPDLHRRRSTSTPGRRPRATATTARPARARTSARRNPDLSTPSSDRVAAYRTENGLAADAMVPVDAVTASAPASTRRSRSPTPACRRRGSPTRAGSTVDRSWTARSTSTPKGATARLPRGARRERARANLALDRLVATSD